MFFIYSYASNKIIGNIHQNFRLLGEMAIKLNKEIRIKSEQDIADDIVMKLVLSVITQGKISNYGKSYCYAIQLSYNGCEYMVESNDKGKSLMFYVYKVKKT